MQFYETDESRGFVRGGKWDVMSTRRAARPARGVRRRAAGGATSARASTEVSEQLGHAARLGGIAEDLPEESNTSRWTRQLTDSDGIPAPEDRVPQLREHAQRLLDFHLERMHEAHEAAGATKTVATPLMRDCGRHVLGTCKMGDDPATSVVDRYGRAHDAPALKS